MNFLWSILEDRLGKNFDTNAGVARAVLEVSRSFTENRKPELGKYLENEAFHSGYLAYFLPLNAAKTEKLLTDHLKNAANAPRRVLDFGCGPGTAAIAYLSWYAKQSLEDPVEITLVDHETHSLDAAQKLVRNVARKLGVEASVHTLPEIASDKAANHDLVLAVNVLNELSANDRFFESLIAQEGTPRRKLLILEPSHRVASQKLIRLRKRLIETKTSSFLKILGPCTHEKECPLFRSSRDWCHFSDRIADPRLVTMGRKIFKSSRDWMKYSYLFLEQTSSAPVSKKNQDGELYRAIGDLHPTRRGTYAIDVCTPGKKIEWYYPKSIAPSKKLRLFRGALIRREPTRQ